MHPSILIASLLLVTGSLAASAPWREQLEQDWLLQARVEADGRKAPEVTTQDDAAGGCDGVTNGRWGFHTAKEENPWWQVDLGASVPLAQVRLWNRCDPEPMARRAAHFRLLLSDDGISWRQVYQHDGTVFHGYHMPDRSPLAVKVPGRNARFVRIQLPGKTFLHLDEVEVIRADRGGNAAARRPANQSSVSQWSVVHRGGGGVDFRAAAATVIARHAHRPEFAPLKARLATLADPDAPSLYLEARARQRAALLQSPPLDFDTLLVTKRVPGSYSHMSDQYYGWWSRPGGGLYLLKNFKTGEPVTESLTDSLFPEPGSFLRPALSYDAKRVIFAWCKHHPHLASLPDKLDKANVPEDAFYHVFEMNLDGTGLRQLTRGKYDDFDARYLPDGRIVFLSTRRGQAVQVTKKSAAATLRQNDLPDCYVRCGGGAERPVAVYTLHTMNADGGDLTPISPFEMFEWEPSVAPDGTILYSRWDYVDRDNMPYMSLWAINPDGTNARLVYGNYTQSPHCTFEPRAVPGSRKIIFTASGHHSQTMGSLVLLDPAAGMEGEAPITRLTPDTPFPEIEGWPTAFYANPWPLSERTHLVAWGVEANMREGHQRPANGMGIYLFDADHGLELLYRDPDISSMYPIPVKAQPPPPVLASTVDWNGPQEGKLLVGDVSRGLASVKPGDIKALRVVAIPAKTQPWMNQPAMGLTRDDPGKVVLGTVPVEPDGSAFFRVPSGVPLFLQALDASGRVVQSMRSATHVQPGQTLSCTGCHDSRRDTPPPATPPLASLREASRLQPGPPGSWPLRFDHLIQPVLDARCTRCHAPGSGNTAAAAFDLTPAAAYESLAHYGRPSLHDSVLAAYREGVSTEGRQPAQTSPLLALLTNHHGVRLAPDELDRFHTWLDTYGQRTGAFSREQEKELLALREFLAPLLDPKVSHPSSTGP
jgi:hypothetical protein